MTVTGAAVFGTGLHDLRQLLPGATRAWSRPTALERADPAEVLGSRGLRYKDRATCLALAATHLALEDAGLLRTGSQHLPDDCAVVVSSNHGNLDTVCEAAAVIAEHGTGHLSPMALPNASSNIAASTAAIRFRLGGPNLTLCNGPASGLDAVHWARRLIMAGRARRALVIGVEADTPVLRSLLGAEGPLFDGAAAVVLEEAGSARERGAHERVRVGGYDRTATLTAGIDALGGVPRISLWLGGQDGGPVPPALATTTVHDLDRVLGDTSGALGVLQCAAAAARPAGAGTTLATAGCQDVAVATLLLEPTGGAA
ncbi:beta-ketoacyl synthase N-terminal-like domain-containing protein [Kitasatospora sp. P5_F3]